MMWMLLVTMLASQSVTSMAVQGRGVKQCDVQPAQIAFIFSDTLVGDESLLTADVTNEGNKACTLTSAVVTPTDGQVTVVSPLTLASGETGTAQVKFAPTVDALVEYSINLTWDKAP